MKVLATQLGARRHYLVPAALEQAGVLQRFVTDYYSTGFTTRVARALPSRMANRAGARRAPDLPSHKVCSFPLFAFSNKIESALNLRNDRQSRRWIRAGGRFATLCRRYLSRETTHVYAFTSAAQELFASARDAGVMCVLDHATAPRKHEMKLVYEEHDRFPGWAAQPERDPHIDDYHARQLEEVRLADVVICNSTFAKRTLLGEGAALEKIAVTPLGVRVPASALYSNRAHRNPGRLRVLYVGAEALRKGIPYLVRALRTLATSSIEARFVGNLGLSEHGIREVKRAGEVVGDVPREQMDSYFRWADVLVLPSISDTFGLVIIEAMARGIPVIASDHTGGPDVLRDSIDGFVVPIRDSDAIAHRLEELVRQPALLFEMSKSSANRATAFSLGAYQARLIEAAQLQGPHAQPQGVLSA